ncbi:MAG: hypothetical protein UY72_C0031G0004 [Candidatus Uhrbacteria bacterium GW2011_GWD2_52_7]|uniref:Uncharacterized protein n=1 Tax=Candidatus Uhrbacteria bacterium GW2011_GWD2_52_7 TaxID=1618989 RepID=A0A0G1ZNW2_9BACT|nr:MAG: hypothetical protein UY72_C0031G0004 [Candidatus Uhrbacteria bacterium GW2011_GWD2_52_7]
MPQRPKQRSKQFDYQQSDARPERRPPRKPKKQGSLHIPKAHYENELSRDPDRFRRKVYAEMKLQLMTVEGKMERLLYLALLAHASTHISPLTGKPDFDRTIERNTRRRTMNMLRSVATTRLVLVRSENSGRKRGMIGVRRLMNNLRLSNNELAHVANIMRHESNQLGLNLPESVFDELNTFCAALDAEACPKHKPNPYAIRFGRVIISSTLRFLNELNERMLAAEAA